MRFRLVATLFIIALSVCLLSLHAHIWTHPIRQLFFPVVFLFPVSLTTWFVTNSRVSNQHVKGNHGGNCTITLQECHFPTPLRHTGKHQFY